MSSSRGSRRSREDSYEPDVTLTSVSRRAPTYYDKVMKAKREKYRKDMKALIDKMTEKLTAAP
jgi:hypothetical protein